MIDSPGTLKGLFESDGFLMATLPANVASDIAAAFAASLDFFHCTTGTKAASVLPEQCGYRPMGLEYSQSPERPDLIESFTVSPRTHVLGRAMAHTAARGLYLSMIRVFDALEHVAEDLAEGVAVAVGAPPSAVAVRGGLRQWSRLQVNYSRPALAKSEALVHDLHEDGNLLTLACATGPGLEVRRRDGSYSPIHADGNEVIAMPGEIMSLLTGGRVAPLYHRVRPQATIDERVALLLFTDLAPDRCHRWTTGTDSGEMDIPSRVRGNVRRFGLAGFNDE